MRQDMKVFIPVTLGMLTAFGPFVTDFYLPVLPEMTSFFHTTPALASMSLTAGMIGLAAGQLFIGPLTDKYGRKRILAGSMVLFAVASLLCILSKDIIMFNLMRVLQGLAGAGGIVIAKSMSTDMYTGNELAKFMALLCAINGIMIGAGAALATRFHNQSHCLRFAGTGMLAGTLVLALLLCSAMPLWIVMAAYVYTMVCFGMLQTPLTAIALDSERDNAGAASAIFGASGFVAGALASPLVGIGDITVSSGVVMACGAVACLLFILPLSSRLRAVAA